MRESLPRHSIFFSPSYRIRLLKAFGLLLLLGSLFLVLNSLSLAAPEEAQLEITLSPSTITVPSGQEFTYSLQYRCASITEDCNNLTVSSVLPAELSGSASHVKMVGSPHTTGTNYDQNTRTLTWTFVDPLPAGSTGTLEMKVRFSQGSTPNNATADVTAVIDADNAPPVTSNQSTATATAEFKCYVAKSLMISVDPALDQETTYRVQLCQPGNAKVGGLDYNNAQLVDKLPAGAQFVSASNDGVYDAGSHSVTWDIGTLEVDDGCASRYVTVIFPSSNFSVGDTIVNNVEATGSPVGQGQVGIGPVSRTNTLIEGTPTVSFDKTGGTTRPIGQSFNFRFYRIANTGNVPLEKYVVEDTIDPAFNVYRINTGKYNTTTSLTIRYKTSDNSTWTDWPGSPFDGQSNQSLNVSDLGIGEAYITALQFDYGTVPSGFNYVSNDPRIYATLISPTNTGGTLAGGDKISNCATLSWEFNGTADSDNDCTTVTVADSSAKLDGDKSERTSGPYLPGDEATYRLRARNYYNAGGDYQNPILVDLLSENLEYVADSWTFDDRNLGATDPTFEKIDNYNNTGRTLLRWSWDADNPFALIPNKYIYIYFKVQVKAGAPAGSLGNTMYITNNSGSYSCSSSGDTVTDELDLDGDNDTTDKLCKDADGLTISSVAAMDSVKYVKGELDADWHKYPESGLTVPGGKADYRLQVQNTGNVPITNLVVVDILPFVGDTGVIDPSARQSEWRPNLIAPVDAPAGVTVFYSSEQNPCRTEVDSAGPAGCTPANWSTVPPADITTVQALKFDFGSIVLAALDSLELTWPMRAPIGAPGNGEIAWNSFGYVANRVDNGSALLPSEPIKVGIALSENLPAGYGNYVWLDENADGMQNEAADKGVNGVRVELYSDDGDGIANPNSDTPYGFTITTSDVSGNPGYYQFTNLPVGCYYARFYRPAIYSITSQDQGSDNAADSDVYPGTGLTDVTCLESDEFDYTWDMGLVPATTATVGNYVWFDRNNDGLQNESTAEGINGITVTLYQDDGDNSAEPGGEDGSPISSTLTDVDLNGNPGYYLFENVDPGSYFICFNLPTQATFTGADSGSDNGIDSDADTTSGCTDVFSLNVGDYDTSWDAGMILPTGNLSLGDRVWFDLDNDATYEPLSNENGINGVRINLYRDSDDNGTYTPATDEFVATTTSFTKAGKDGYYEFSELIADDYIVQVDPTNFMGNGPLKGLSSSTGNEPTPDPDNDTDHDDNGDAMAEQGVVSQAVTLSDGDEPESDHNPTVDFGFIAPTDFGDAPDSPDGPDNYKTTMSTDGARHIIDKSLYLGSTVDAEEDGQPTATADGDDNDAAGDDEDGVTFYDALEPDSTANIDVQASAACTLSAWIDFNGDGSWAESYDELFPGGTALSAGTNSLSFSVPMSATTGIDTYARFRCTTDGAVDSSGVATDGEVEDYVVRIPAPAAQTDFGDAPDSYGTLFASNGANHIITDLYLGAGVDGEEDGQPSNDADGDDSTGVPDDEDGVTFDNPVQPGATVNITIVASNTCVLSAWMDFAGDGSFAGDDLFAGGAGLVPGSNALSFTVPLTASVGIDSYARFRCTTDGQVSYIGAASDGEVEDYKVSITAPNMDFGDAPDPTYMTTSANDGARHILDGETYLGSSADADTDGQPTADADGDDTDAGGDDEDGVTFDSTLNAGSQAQITVVASAACTLSAWIDFNGDGWDAGDELFAGGTLLSAGSNALSFTVPADATAGIDSYARFRCTTSGPVSYNGIAQDGEVEDYLVKIEGALPTFDFGDAPSATYPTLAPNGARHIIDGTTYLGAGVDAEDDGQPTADADGDDNDADGDDEDGVTFLDNLEPGNTSNVSVVASTACTLSGWIDFNGDGWDNSGDKLFVGGANIITGTNTLSFTVPISATEGIDTYARFRCTTDGEVSVDGVASDGEVEDYKVSITAQPKDFGDAPDSYKTTLTANGPSHIVSELYLGSTVDANDDGLPTPSANGDDSDAGGDDEDGVSFVTALQPGSTAEITVVASGICTLSAWIDFNGDGSFDEVGDNIFPSGALLAAGSNSLSFPVPAGATAGAQTYARFRCASSGVLDYTGPAADGEVEDYQVSIASVDFGDAPASYATELGSNGARHALDGVTYLGASVDAENDGQPTNGAAGDDADDDGDDENGVTFQSTLKPGNTVNIDVEASAACTLSAWIDFDGNGSFAEANNELFTGGTLLSAGSNALSFTVPEDATLGETYARFRCTTTGAVSFNGAASDGEVEDYQVSIVAPDMDFGDVPADYPTLLANDGARHIIDGSTYLGAGVDSDSDGQPTAEANGDDNDADGDDEDGVTFITEKIEPGKSVDIDVVASQACTLSAWIDFNGNASFADSGESLFPGGRALTAGTNSISFNVPEDATPDISTYARFRCTTTGPVSYSGLAANGEVEDYKVDVTGACTTSIGDVVWLDSNGDGVQDDGEPGISGVVVMLKGAGDDEQLGTADDVIYPAQTTDNQGAYRFADLPPGQYEVDIDESTLTQGLALTTGNEPFVTLAECGNTDADFGYAPSLCQRDVMYGVHDANSASSQFFVLDLGTGASSPLGGLRNFDVESIEIHPTTGQLYAVSGKDGKSAQRHQLYALSKENGDLTPIGNGGAVVGEFGEIVSAAFDNNGTLWAFEELKGLVTIDLTSGNATLQWDVEGSGLGNNWEGLAWSPDGQYLYGAEGSKMYRWDPNTQTAEQVCGDSFLPDATEALDYRFDGKLMGGWHNATDGTLSLFEVDLASCSILPTQFDMPYNDIESLASEECVTGGSVQGQVANGGFVRNRAANLMANTQVRLDVDTDGNGEAGFTTYTTTDENGRYNFVNLPLGDYTISVEGSQQTTTFTVDENNLEKDIDITVDNTSTSYSLFLPAVTR